jgi:hypothetical protein
MPRLYVELRELCPGLTWNWAGRHAWAAGERVFRLPAD